MPGTFGDVLYGLNVDFSGSTPISGNINLNGELLVGAIVAPFIRPYVPTGSNGLVVNTGPGTIDFTLANIPNSALQNSTFTVSAGTGLSGGGGVSLGSAVTLNLSTPVNATNGGTGVSNPTAHSIQVGAGSSALTQIAVGSTGQVLQANTAADPSWSTSTYPSSSGGTGKILYDNGTNFIESTPTFPASASATSRKIIVSDGTNWVASTETYAVPGTNNNVMTSDGTNWTSATPKVIYKTISLTAAQMNALNGSPITIVNAVSGQVIWVVQAIAEFAGTSAFSAAGSTVQLQIGSTAITAALPTSFFTGTVVQYYWPWPLVSVTTWAGSTYQNVALTINNPGTNLSGTGSLCNFSVVYYVI